MFCTVSFSGGKKHDDTPPTGPTAKCWLTQGKAVFDNLFGDQAILRAMRDNEKDTNTAYDRMTHHKKEWVDIKDILEKGFQDEQKHKKWLDKSIIYFCFWAHR